MKKYFPILCLCLGYILVLTLAEEVDNSLKTFEVLLTLALQSIF